MRKKGIPFFVTSCIAASLVLTMVAHAEPNVSGGVFTYECVDAPIAGEEGIVLTDAIPGHIENAGNSDAETEEIDLFGTNYGYPNTHVNTGNQREDIVAVARTQIGYREDSNNDTKYGEWYGLNYNSWCAMFVSWCARQANIPTSILKNSAGAGHSAAYFNIPYQDGASFTPQRGDLFFTKSWSHVGLVDSVDGNTIITVEGNYDNQVISLRRNKNELYFGTPAYTNNQASFDATPSISGHSIPNDYQREGVAFNVRGIVSCAAPMSAVHVYVLDGGGAAVTGRSVYPNTTSYDIKNVDYDVKFSKLPATRIYEYKITAIVNGKEYLLFSKWFWVVNSSTRPFDPWINQSGDGNYRTITWGASYAAGYHIDVRKNGELVRSEDLGNVTSMSDTFSPGSTVVYITAYNGAGGSDTVSTEISIPYPTSAPKPTASPTPKPTAATANPKATPTTKPAAKPSAASSTGNTSAPMYRLYNAGNREHFYTASSHEKDVLVSKGWKYEGVGWYAPANSKTPVYRLYNPILRDHHYTTSANEKNVLSSKYGWKYEGIGWYSDDAKSVPLYRRYCPFLISGAHHYTTGLNEAKHLVSVGWKDEGVAWYGVKTN